VVGNKKKGWGGGGGWVVVGIYQLDGDTEGYIREIFSLTSI